MPNLYCAAEPAEVIAFQDQAGDLHTDRADAIKANFQDDFEKQCLAIAEHPAFAGKFHTMNMTQTIEFVRAFIVNNVEIVRVLIGDREAT